MWQCPKCETYNEDQQRNCMICGEPRPSAPARPQPTQTQPQQQEQQHKQPENAGRQPQAQREPAAEKPAPAADVRSALPKGGSAELKPHSPDVKKKKWPVVLVALILIGAVCFALFSGAYDFPFPLTAAPTSTPVSTPTPSPVPTPTGRGTLRSDTIADYAVYTYVLGSDYSRETIRSIRFLDTLSGMPSDAWDVSTNGDGSVQAWVTGSKATDDKGRTLYDLTIAANGGVKLNADSSRLFSHYKNMTDIDFGGCVDTSAVTDMSDMFTLCGSLKSLDLSSFNTANVTNMYNMFSFCSSLKSLDLSPLNTENVTNMSWMFDGCRSLKSLDLSSLNTENVTNMSWMFYDCRSLESLDLSALNTAKVKNMSRMFFDCKSLTSVRVSDRFVVGEGTNTDSMFLHCPVASIDRFTVVR